MLELYKHGNSSSFRGPYIACICLLYDTSQRLTRATQDWLWLMFLLTGIMTFPNNNTFQYMLTFWITYFLMYCLSSFGTELLRHNMYIYVCQCICVWKRDLVINNIKQMSSVYISLEEVEIKKWYPHLGFLFYYFALVACKYKDGQCLMWPMSYFFNGLDLWLL